jgi:hypothetical protein
MRAHNHIHAGQARHATSHGRLPRIADAGPHRDSTAFAGQSGELALTVATRRPHLALLVGGIGGLDRVRHAQMVTVKHSRSVYRPKTPIHVFPVCAPEPPVSLTVPGRAMKWSHWWTNSRSKLQHSLPRLISANSRSPELAFSSRTSGRLGWRRSLGEHRFIAIPDSVNRPKLIVSEPFGRPGNDSIHEEHRGLPV